MKVKGNSKGTVSSGEQSDVLGQGGEPSIIYQNETLVPEQIPHKSCEANADAHHIKQQEFSR